MTQPTHTEAGMVCIPCKVIIDCGGATAAAVSAVAAFASASAALRDTVLKADEEGALGEVVEYEAAAWSQLQCNRAMHIIELANKWTKETLLYGQKIAGVYVGGLGYTVNGIEGITKK